MSEEKELKRIVRKHINVLQAEVIKKHLNSKYSKWKLKIAGLLRIAVADKHQYLFRISYKGSTRLKINDIVATPNGELFGVMKEENRIALIASSIAYDYKPNVHGKLFIVEKSKVK